MSSTRRNLNNAHSNTPNSIEYKIGDYVQLKNKEGFIRYIGKRKHNHGIWYGIELLKGTGPTDGSEHGERYFSCKRGKGIFVRRYSLKKKVYPPPTDTRKKYKRKKPKLQQQTRSETTHTHTVKTKTNIYNSIKRSENESTQSINYNTSFENKLKFKNTVSHHTPNKPISKPSFGNSKSEYISSTHQRNDSMSNGTTRTQKKQNITKRFEQRLKQHSSHNLHDSQQPPTIQHANSEQYYPSHGIYYETAKMDSSSSMKTLQTIYDGQEQHAVNMKRDKNARNDKELRINVDKNVNKKPKSRGSNSYSDSMSHEMELSPLPDMPSDVKLIGIEEVKLEFGYDLKDICEDKTDNEYYIPIPKAMATMTSDDLHSQIEAEYRHSQTFTALRVLDMSSVSSCESVDMKELELDKNEQLDKMRNRFDSVNGVINNMLHTLIANDNLDDFKVDIQRMSSNDVQSLIEKENKNNNSKSNSKDDELDQLFASFANNINENGNTENNNNINENDYINHELLTLHSTTETSAKSESVSVVSTNRKISNTSEFDHEIKTKIKLRASESEQSNRSERNINEDLIRSILANIDIQMNVNISTKQSVTSNINTPSTPDDEKDSNIWNILNEMDELENNINEMEQKQEKIIVYQNKMKQPKEENMFSKFFDKLPLILTHTSPEVVHHLVPPSYEEAITRYRIKSQKENYEKKLLRKNAQKIQKNAPKIHNNEHLEEIVCVSMWDRITAAMKQL